MATESMSVVCDIVILSSEGNLPSGYDLVEPPLYMVAKTQERRYLAYKKQMQAPKVFAVTDIAVRKDSALVPPSYKTLNYTTPDNLESFPDEILLIKKEGWSAVLNGIPSAIVDILILHKSKKNDMPSGYKMTHEIKGMCVCFKRSNLKYTHDDDYEEYDDDDVFGETSENEGYYEIPNSTKVKAKKPVCSNHDNDDTDGNTNTRDRRKVIKSLPIDDDNMAIDGGIYPQTSQLTPLYTNLSLSTGYPLSQFLTPPPSSVLCAKCNDVLISPYVLSCCKSFVCENCLLTIQRSTNTTCPSCNNSDYDFQTSVKMKEEVDMLLIKCTNYTKGCKWQGQSGELDIHMFINCPYAEILCEDGCNGKFLRSESTNHHCTRSTISTRRPPVFDRSVSSVEQLSHRIFEIQRKQTEDISYVKNEIQKYHTAKQLSSPDNHDTVKLSFDVRSLKRQLAECLQRELVMERKMKQQQEEIRILKETHNMFRLQFDNLIDQLQVKKLHSSPPLPISPIASPTTHKQPPCEFVINQFHQYLSKPDAEWYSESFVSDLHGYKFCLQVVANGMISSAGSDVSICVKLMRGEYDHQLKWPFQGKITVQILNWICDQRHATRVIDFNIDAKRYGACGRVPTGCIGDRATKGWGILPFLPHGYLPYNKERNTEFMRNSRVCIRVAAVTVL